MNKKTPDIRFKGFSDDWEQRKLSEYKDVRDGTHDSPKYHESGHPLVTSKNLKSFGLDMTDISLISTQDFDAINKRSKVDKGDILFGMIGTIGNPVIVETDGFAIKNVALIKNGGSITNRFLIQLLKSPIFDKYIRDENVGNTQKFIGLNKIREFHFLSPIIEEQNKISMFLNKLDYTIALHQQKLDLLKQSKKSFLQTLFPKKEKPVPNIRFSGFDEEWEQLKLGEVLKVNSGKDYKHLKDGNVPVYGTGGYMVSVNEKLSDKDSIGIGRKGSIDKPQYLEAPFWTVDTLFYMTPFSDFNLHYLYSMSQRINWKKYDESTGVPSLSKVNIENIDYFFPLIEEQVKIGELFKKFDNTIALHQGKIESLKQMKKALLQKMFI